MANPLLDFLERSKEVLTAGFRAGKKKFEEGDAPTSTDVTANRPLQVEADYGRPYEAPDEEARKERRRLRDQITDAFKIEDEDERRASLNELANKGVNDMGIAPELFEREVEEADAENKAAMAEQKRKDDYNRFFESRSRTMGAGQKRRLYSRRDRLKLAKQLRKDGFSKAAEQVALDYARSPEASAPAISTPQMRRRRLEDRAEADDVRQMNQGLTRLLIQKTEQQLRDPDFKLNLNF